MSKPISYTHSSLATARRCLREYDLRYLRQLELVAGEKETLAVGSCWHDAHDAATRADDDGAAFRLITNKAPNDLWAEKLRRLFAAHGWYWESQPLQVIASEQTFEIEVEGILFTGQIDAVVETPDGRRGIMERKTTSDGLAADSLYWNRLRMDPQCGIYTFAATSLPELNGELPAFTLYDVVRKPTINPKGIAKKDASRMQSEAQGPTGLGEYYRESFGLEEINRAIGEKRESSSMFGARLTSDIGDRPDYYFARREVARTVNDLETIQRELLAQIALVEDAAEHGRLHRNPESCAVFGTCDFFGLCSHGVVPAHGEVPDGFRVREHRHPELNR